MLEDLPSELKLYIFQKMLTVTHEWSADVWGGERDDANCATAVNGYVKWLIQNERRIQNGMPKLKSYYKL